MKITSDCGAEHKLICFKGIDLISEQFCWFWYAVCHRNIVAVIMTMRAITYQWSRNFVSFSSFLLVVAIDKLYRDTKKISTNSQLYNPNLSALIFLFRKEVGSLCHFFVTCICFKKEKRSDVPRIFSFFLLFMRRIFDGVGNNVQWASTSVFSFITASTDVQGPLKQSVFLNFTIVKKCLNPYPN